MKKAAKVCLFLVLVVVATSTEGDEHSLAARYHGSWARMRSMFVFHHFSCTLEIDKPVDHFSLDLLCEEEYIQVQTWAMDKVNTANVTDNLYQSKRTMYPPRIVMNYHASSISRFRTMAVQSCTCKWTILTERLTTQSTTTTGTTGSPIFVQPGFPGFPPRERPAGRPNKLAPEGDRIFIGDTPLVFNESSNGNRSLVPVERNRRGSDPESTALPTMSTMFPSSTKSAFSSSCGTLAFLGITEDKSYQMTPSQPGFPNIRPAPRVPIRRFKRGSNSIIPVIHKDSSAGILEATLHFFDVQQSGPLRADHAFAWMKPSGLNDVTPDGRDLTGGWYTGNDAVKMNFPMASAVTLLGLSFNAFRDVYTKFKLDDDLKSILQSPLDYFMKCWDKENEVLYVQVGSLEEDRKLWDRFDHPVYSTLKTQNKWPIYSVSATKPGSDVAAEMASALVTTASIYGGSNATQMKTTAQELYAFAKKYQGKYSDSVPTEHQDYPTYTSSGYEDEMCLAAILLYQEFYTSSYLVDAKQFFEEAPTVPPNVSWDNKFVLCAIKLYTMTWGPTYKMYVDKFFQAWSDHPPTSAGYLLRADRGGIDLLTNMIFTYHFALENGFSSKLKLDKLCLDQMKYIIGDNPASMSYVVGVTSNYPMKIRHKHSSCPGDGEPCGWDFYSSGANNTYVVPGAVVGGPSKKDTFADVRTNKKGNSVSINNNAGFIAALFGIELSKHTLQLSCADEKRRRDSTEAPTTTPTTTQTTQTTRFVTPPATPVPEIPQTFDYLTALNKSLQFYTSRKMPMAENNRGHFGLLIPLTGWNDDDAYVQTSIVSASAVSLLGWGAIKYKSTYFNANLLGTFAQVVDEPIRHLRSSLMRYSNDQYSFKVKEGDEIFQRASWIDLDYMSLSTRKARSVSFTDDVSDEDIQDVLAEISTSFSMGTLLMAEFDPTLSENLLESAKQFYDLALKSTGTFNNSESVHYKPTSFDSTDEVCVAAMWLFKATGDISYVTNAKALNVVEQKELSWNNKHILCQLLLYEVTGDAKYQLAIERFLSYWVEQVPYTPQGLAYHGEEGQLRYAANAAFVALLAADLGFSPATNRAWAKSQIDYMLGKNNQAYSYLIGYGNRYPRRPHDRATSCSDRRECDWSSYNSPSPNPTELTGALVGGPNIHDFHEDARTNYTMNRIAIDYNAGFQSVLAGLATLYPEATTQEPTTKAVTIQPVTLGVKTTNKPTDPPETDTAKPPATTARTTKKTTTEPTTKKATAAPTTKKTTSKPQTTTPKNIPAVGNQLPVGTDGAVRSGASNVITLVCVVLFVLFYTLH